MVCAFFVAATKTLNRPHNDQHQFVSARIRLIDPFGVNRSDNKLSLRLRVVCVLKWSAKIRLFSVHPFPIVLLDQPS